MENTTLLNITIIFAVSLPVLYVFLRLKLPSILGFLFTGIALGPYGFGIIRSVSEVEVLAEIGVVLLLFTIGIEFSLSNLLKIKRSVLIAGTFQMLTTIAAGFVAAMLCGFSIKKAFFIGFLVVMSSTAIVFKLLQERAELASPHGMNSAAILIFQDLMVVPLILIVPYLAEGGLSGEGSLLVVLAKALTIIGIMIIAARWIIPKVLYFTVKTRSSELFLLLITVICLATAWLTHAAGLSPALGAFMAGLIISESEYSHEAIGNIVPFKDAFTGLFFVSVGMLADIRIVFHFPVIVPAIVFSIIVIKALLTGVGVLVLGYPMRTALLTGLYLAQIGEFSFILARIGHEKNIIMQNEYQLFIIIVVVAMGLTPFFIKYSVPVVNFLQKLHFMQYRTVPAHPEEDDAIPLSEHLIIVGYGVNGRNLAKAAKFAGIAYVIIEMNPDTVRKEKESGENIFFGDASHEAVLEHAGIQEAKVMVVAIADHAATLRITKIARGVNPDLYIIIRTRFFQDVPAIYALGANEVIPEEYETSIEIFSRVLSKYLLPRQDIEKMVALIRSEGYGMLRSLSLPDDGKQTLVNIPELEITRIGVCAGSMFDGKTLQELHLRMKYGITILAIERAGTVIANPDSEEKLLAGDMLIVMGNRTMISSIYHLFDEGAFCEA
jgi:CPA2 family monovalent cation:H+ antiporter-2